MPSVVFFALALFLSIGTMLLVAIVIVGDRERDLASKRLMAAAHVGVELRALVAKTVLVVVASTLETYDQLQAVILAATSMYLVWIYIIGVRHFGRHASPPPLPSPSTHTHLSPPLS